MQMHPLKVNLTPSDQMIFENLDSFSFFIVDVEPGEEINFKKLN